MISLIIDDDKHGLSVENKFLQIARNKYGTEQVKTASKEDNMFNHIDCYINDVSYDVKTEKKLNRSDEDTSPDVIWVEYKNVRGYDGWIVSPLLQKIAFYRNGKFYIVDREVLKKYVDSIIEDEQIYTVKQYKKFYRRRDRPDEKVTYVYFSDIEDLVEEII